MPQTTTAGHRTRIPLTGGLNENPKRAGKDQQRTCEDVQTDPKAYFLSGPGKEQGTENQSVEISSTKQGQKSGTQTVLDMIKRSQKGIEAGTLIEKTGFEDKKIRNILFKALTDGKIERVGRGVYKSSR